MELTKQKFEDFIKEATKATAMELFAEFRTEQERKQKEADATIESRLKAITEARSKAAGQLDDAQKGMGVAQIARSFAAGRGDMAKAVLFAKEQGFSEDIQKALSAGTPSAGGFIIPPGYSSDFIELLYNRVAVRKLGATSLPMPNGNLTVPKLATGITASYIGENIGDNSQKPSFGVIGLSWKKLRATVAMSNDLLRYSSPKADGVVKNDMTNAFSVAEDAQFLRGTGTGTAPKGLDSWIPTSAPDHDVAASSADGSDLTLVIADLFTLPRLLEESNIPFIKPGWVISPRTKFFLMSVRDSVGNFYFLDEMKRGTLLGYPFVATNQVPSNLGGTTDESVIYFGDWVDAIIGESDELMLDTSQEASYLDESGNLVSAFSLDQTVIRGIARHDFCVRRVESFAKLSGVKWGK